MRWIGAAAVLIVLGTIIGIGNRTEPGSPVDPVLEALIVRAAEADEVSHRHQSAGLDCTICHGAELDVSEVPPMSLCLSCHGSYDAVAALTSDLVPNPHHSHMGEVTCTECHSEHQPSRLSCNQCHIFEMDVP